MAIESDRQLTKHWTKMAKLDLQVNFCVRFFKNLQRFRCNTQNFLKYSKISFRKYFSVEVFGFLKTSFF